MSAPVTSTGAQSTLASRYAEMHIAVDQALSSLKNLLSTNTSGLLDKDGYMAILEALLPLDSQFNDEFVSDNAFLARLAGETGESLSSCWKTFKLAYMGMLQADKLARDDSIDNELGRVKSAWRSLGIVAFEATRLADTVVSKQGRGHTIVGMREGKAFFLHPVEEGDGSSITAAEGSIAEGLPDCFFNLSILAESDGKERLNNFHAGSQMGLPASSSAAETQSQEDVATEQQSVVQDKAVLLKSAAELMAALAALEKGNKVDQEADDGEKAASSAFAGLSLDEKFSNELAPANGSAITIGGRPYTVVTIDSLPSKWGATRTSP
jgi:hypothetical protein